MVGDIHMVEFHGVGDIYVFDLGIVNMGHVMKLSPAVLKKSDIAARVKRTKFLAIFIRSICHPKFTLPIHVFHMHNV